MTSTIDRLLLPDAAWGLTLYPEAGEAGGSFRSSVRRGGSLRLPLSEAAARARSRHVADMRARAQIRRYATANALTRLATLTYGPPGVSDDLVVRDDMASFSRTLRQALGGDPLPYLWVPERHKSGLLHVHVGLGQYVRQSQLADVWGHGFVSIKRLGGPPVGASPWHASRIAAGYLAKYVSKDFSGSREGLHRYEVAQGFQPRRMRFEGRSADDVLLKASEVMGRAPVRAWRSDDVLTWDGPPARWYQWA